jgi:exosortase/archaeosortase family protein
MLLQEWATAGSSLLLGLLGIPHLLTGLIIEIPGQRLLVEEACSGINSVLFMTSACVFYAMWQRRSVLFLGLLYALTIGCVLAGNLVRITSGAWVLFHFQIDLFAGWKHEALGLVLTGFYLGFIVVADTLLGWVFTSKTRYRTTEADEKPEPVLAGWSFSGGIRFVTVLLAILGAVQLVRGWDFHFRKENARRINPAWMDGSAKFTLPQEIDGWRLVSDV